MNVASQPVIDALQVTVIAIGQEPNPQTIAVIAHELAAYPEARVLAALSRCKTECKFRLSLADIIERMDDGHPGPEEAWDLVPKSERETSVVTQEIMAAIPFDLIAAGDMTAARMAFREAYSRALSQARAERKAPAWFPSLGHDKGGREAPLLRAVQLGRLSGPAMRKLLPPPGDGGTVLAMVKRIGVGK